MCDICHCSPCNCRCPNYTPKAVHTCKACGEPIVDGEEYAEIEGDYFHIECLDDVYKPSELLEMLGMSTRIAMEED